MKKLLRLKHWQVFLVLVLLPVAGVTALMIAAHFAIDVVKLVAIVPFLTTLFSALQLGWLYTLGVSLYKLVPPPVKMNIPFFRFLFIPPLIYLLCSFAMGLLMVGRFGETLSMAGNTSWPALIKGIRIVQFMSIFSVLYFLYFISKALRSVEHGEEAGFSDYISVYLLLLFLPVGVWIIQPRLNELADAPVKEVNPEILDGEL